MNDLPPDLPRLRTLETWLAHTLDRVRRQIDHLERREQETQRSQQNRPPAPAWILELGPSADALPACLHTCACWATGRRNRGVDRVTALRALTDGVPACPECRPDTALQILD
ncbi:DUF6233 domain-containing protein [Streptomyces fuscichromogenes]|uniref:DUF6233 domain-containing protein n=1 Tax=Streptomyces fuscichromogenes TaxID=1324013 RepID=UPI0037F26308